MKLLGHETRKDSSDDWTRSGMRCFNSVWTGGRRSKTSPLSAEWHRWQRSKAKPQIEDVQHHQLLSWQGVSLFVQDNCGAKDTRCERAVHYVPWSWSKNILSILETTAPENALFRSSGRPGRERAGASPRCFRSPEDLSLRGRLSSSCS